MATFQFNFNNNQIFLPYKEISLLNIRHLLQWTIGKVLTFYYNHDQIIDDMEILQQIVHVFMNTLKTCFLRYENNHETLCEENVNLTQLMFLFHYSRVFVDNQRIDNIITKNRFRTFIRLRRIIFHDMIEYKNNDFIYIIDMKHDFHVEYFKNIILKSKRFLSLLSLTCNDKCHMNIDEDSLIEQLNMIENKLNVCNIKLPVLGLSGLNNIVYQNKEALMEHVWSKLAVNARLLVNLIHEFFYVFLTSYSNDFSCGTPHRIESLEGGYLFEKEIFGTIKYNFWYDDSCCQLIFDENTWLRSTNNCLFTNDILGKLDNMSKANRKYLRNIPDIKYSGIEYGVNTQPAYE